MNASIQKISSADFLVELRGTQTPLVIDVRTRAEVANELLEGCVNMPLHTLTAEQVKSCIQQNSTAEKPVYLLCGSGKRAVAAADKLSPELLDSVWVIEGGIQALKQAGCILKQNKGGAISLERQVRIVAGSLVLLGVLAGMFLNSGFYALAAFVGAGLIFAGITDTCAMAMLLARMPWNSVAR